MFGSPLLGSPLRRGFLLVFGRVELSFVKNGGDGGRRGEVGRAEGEADAGAIIV